MNKWFLFLLVIVFVFSPLVVACSSDDSPAVPDVQEAAVEEEETTVEEPVTESTENGDEVEDEPEEVGSDEDDEVLFTSFTIPPDWPNPLVPIMREFNVTSYERTENSMYAAGYGELHISRVNNYYMNARKEVGTSFDWEFDPTKDSVTEGDEQVFYYIDDAGNSLTIKFREVENDRTEFELFFEE